MLFLNNNSILEMGLFGLLFMKWLFIGNMAPKNWEEILFLAQSNRLGQFHRLESVTNKYNMHMSRYKDIYHTPEDMILHRILNYPSYWKYDDCSRSLKRTVDVQSITTNHTAFVPNEFPYNIDPNIKHYLLWSFRPLTPREIREKIEDHIASDQYEYVYFINPNNLKSIKNIPHVHVMIRKIPNIL